MSNLKKAIRVKLPIPEEKFESTKMLDHLKLFEERCSQKGETMGMEVYTLSCCAKSWVKLFLYYDLFEVQILNTDSI